MVRRLIEKGLMFGNLIEVASPVLVERYNRALAHLTGKTTALDHFHIDISGYSPEIGDELDDQLYLNHAGVNRQFILLTTEQRTAPLLNAAFSTSRGILRQFIETNESELFALTARDAVAGELVNSIYDAAVPDRLLEVRKVRVEADTTGQTVSQARDLRALIERFKTEPDGWHDDVLIAEMISLAKTTGDVTRNPVTLRQMSFEQEAFWTAHFGGLFIFRTQNGPLVIAERDAPVFDAPDRAEVLTLADRGRIARFLSNNGLVEHILEAKGVASAAILRQKMDFMIVDAAAGLGVDLEGATRRDLRGLARRLSDRLPEAFRGLAALVRWAEDDGPWPHVTSDHPAYFYTLRAAQGPNADLVNRLLSALGPMDIRQLFICHKEEFYRAYAGWAEAKQAYVADFLEREYQVDKAGARAALFGSEPEMSSPEGPDLVDLVGPWGAVRRSK